MNKPLLIAILAVALTGCAATPPLDDVARQQIRASVPEAEGSVKFATVAIWLPNSKEFVFSVVEPTIKGVAVLTEKSLLFQQWGGQNGLTTAKRIPLTTIQNASLISFGLSGRLVILSKDGQYDSFAASDGTGEVSIGASTVEMHGALLSLRPDLDTKGSRQPASPPATR